MYQKIVPLNSNQHAKLKYSEPKSYAFAAGLQTVPLVEGEFAEAQKAFPIVFTAGENKELIPVGLMGLRPSENLFVGSDGTWQGTYMPAFLRRYPFMVADNPQEKKLILCFDEAYAGISESAGEPLFAEGKESELLKKKVEFVNRFHTDAMATKAFVAKMQELDLFSEMSVKLKIPGEAQDVGLRGFSVIDQNKLKKISDAALRQLFDSNMLMLIHAHSMSLSSLNRLIDLAAKRHSTLH